MIKVGDFECYDTKTANAVANALQEVKRENELMADFYRSRGVVAARYHDGWINREEGYTQFPYADFLDKYPEAGDLIAITTLISGKGWIDFARITKVTSDKYRNKSKEYSHYHYSIEKKIRFDLAQGGEINTHPFPHLVEEQ